MYKFVKPFACAAFFSGMLGSALAADLPMPAPQAPAPALPTFALVPPEGLLVTVGAGAETYHTFPGSKTYDAYPLPYFDWRKPGEPEAFHAPDDGFDIKLFDYWGFKAGPVGRYIPERGLRNGNGNFYGLPNVGWTAELGGFLEYWPTDWLRGRVEVRQGVNGNRGLDGNLEVDAIGHYGPWTASLGPRAAFGDDRYMSAYYSVSPNQAAINGRVYPYNATGGFSSVGVMGTLKYKFSPAWSVMTFAGYNRSIGSAGASPISNNLGSKDEFIGGAILEYTFDFHGFGLGIFGL